ncbi:MAG: PrsW family intramembrane metalloprotease [Saprospiraceae bacterium]|nr:PrsW family intramembrane metalloprotease [Saprospiraceae bacterium]
MNGIEILSLFISPVIFLLMFFYLKVRLRVKSFKLLLQAILFGLLSVALLYVAHLLSHLMGLDELKNIKRTAFYTLVIIGFSSELAKFLVLRYCFLPQQGFRGPLEGIIYSVIISLGFATGAIFLFGFNIIGSHIDTLYLFLYPFFSILSGIIMGFFVGLGKSRKNRFVDSMTGLGAAVFFQGLFNFCFCTNDKRLLIIFCIGTAIIALLLAIKGVNTKVNGEEIQDDL